MRRTRSLPRRLIVASVLTGCVLLACNAITGLSDDFSLAAPGQTDGDVDGSVDGADGSESDAGSDGTVAPDADAQPSDFCTAAAADAGSTFAYCTDFEVEDLTGLVQATVDVDAGAGGTVAIVRTGGKGGSSALEATIPQGAGDRRRAIVRINAFPGQLASGSSHFEIDVDVSFAAASDLNYMALATLAFTSGSEISPPELGCGALGGNDGLLINTPITDAGFPFAPNEWNHVHVVVDVSADKATFVGNLLVNGTSFTSATSWPASAVGSRRPEVWLGVYNTSSNNGGAQVRFDNLVVKRR